MAMPVMTMIVPMSVFFTYHSRFVCALFIAHVGFARMRIHC
jgi:hypothetical protein